MSLTERSRAREQPTLTAPARPRARGAAQERSASSQARRPGDVRVSLLGRTDPVVADAFATAREVPEFGTDLAKTLDWCVRVGGRAPHPADGRTAELWQLLAGTAAIDVGAARILEPHLDALAILGQAGTNLAGGRDPWGLRTVGVTRDSSWGVYAAEAPGTILRATEEGTSWILSGTKAWCSLAHDVTHALVTAFVDDSNRRLFAVDLRAAGVRPHAGPWHARGLPRIVSAPVDFDAVPAVPIGDAGWYLARPGFAWGGMSVAAVWWGGAAGLMDALMAPAASDRADQLSFVHLGRVDAALWGARAVLAEAATLIDVQDPADRRAATLLAERVRSIVADAATLALAEADAALGPAPLVADPAHARRVADLHLYLRQHHGLRDVARIGRSLAAAESSS